MANVQFENPSQGIERRVHERRELPSVYIQVQGKTLHTANWSLGGMAIEGANGTLSTGALISIEEMGLGENDLVSVHVRGRVSRADAANDHTIIQFLDIDPVAHTLLTTCLKEFDNVYSQ